MAPIKSVSISDAMIDAGVPAYKIRVGAFGDPQQRQYSRVTVLLNNM